MMLDSNLSGEKGKKDGSTVTVAVGEYTSDKQAQAMFPADSPPPAYEKPEYRVPIPPVELDVKGRKYGTSSAVKVARIVAYTVISVCLMIGIFILAALWIQTRSTHHRQINVEATDEQLKRLAALPLVATDLGSQNQILDSSSKSEEEKEHRGIQSEEKQLIQEQDNSEQDINYEVNDQISMKDTQDAEDAVREQTTTDTYSGLNANNQVPPLDSYSRLFNPDRDMVPPSLPGLDLDQQMKRLIERTESDDMMAGLAGPEDMGPMKCVRERQEINEPGLPGMPPVTGERTVIKCHSQHTSSGVITENGVPPSPFMASKAFRLNNPFHMSGPVRLPLESSPALRIIKLKLPFNQPHARRFDHFENSPFGRISGRNQPPRMLANSLQAPPFQQLPQQKVRNNFAQIPPVFPGMFPQIIPHSQPRDEDHMALDTPKLFRDLISGLFPDRPSHKHSQQDKNEATVKKDEPTPDIETRVAERIHHQPMGRIRLPFVIRIRDPLSELGNDNPLERQIHQMEDMESIGKDIANIEEQISDEMNHRPIEDRPLPFIVRIRAPETNLEHNDETLPSDFQITSNMEQLTDDARIVHGPDSEIRAPIPPNAFDTTTGTGILLTQEKSQPQEPNHEGFTEEKILPEIMTQSFSNDKPGSEDMVVEEQIVSEDRRTLPERLEKLVGRLADLADETLLQGQQRSGRDLPLVRLSPDLFGSVDPSSQSDDRQPITEMLPPPVPSESNGNHAVFPRSV